MATQDITRDKVSGDALFILKNLKENQRLGRSNKLADVKGALENSVTLEFDSYFFFLRKFHYIARDREAQLKLTDAGDQVVEGDFLDKFSDEIAEFFADQLNEGTATDDLDSTIAPSRTSDGDHEPRRSPPMPLSLSMPPPPPPTTAPPPPPPPPKTGARRGLDEPAATAPEPPRAFSPPPAPLPLTAVAQPTMQPIQMQTLAPSQPAASKGQDLDLRYQKFDQLGAGPLGTVFKGKATALGLDVSIKELKDIFGYFSFLQRGEVIKRLKKELCAQAQVRHPGIVQILDQNTDIARPYFVMELAKGSLRERLDAANGKGLPVAESVRIFLQLSYGLKAAHAAGLTHHNIKPENVLFDPLGNAKLGDFGLGRVIEVDQSKGMPQVFVGTGGMGYMSPELIGRSKDAGNSSDVYGLGILLYEMLTGQLPGRRSPLPSEINSESPAKLDTIFDKMTQDRRESRYPDFDAVFDAFYSAFGKGEYLTRGDLILNGEARE